ncbi:MAG: class I SAM-dependent methyltransferase [Candidatus Bathyarchaeia archaeon]
MAKIQTNWENYYSTLRRMPRRMMKTAQFIVDAVPDLKKQNVKAVLDLGCGAGRHCVLLANSGFEVIGIDISKSALRIATGWTKRERLKNVAFVRATMTNIPLRDCCLDAVISISVIHHGFKKDVETTMKEVHRTLQENGKLLVNLASVKDSRYGKGKRLEKNTYWILESYEKDRFEELHHFLTKQEVSKLLQGFTRIQLGVAKEKPNYWEIMAVK